MIIELSMCEADRQALGGPQWLRLDTERLLDTPAEMLMRWEAETGLPIERAIGDLDSGRPLAASTLVLLWLARKQLGEAGGGIDEDTNLPEPYSRLRSVRTLRVEIRRARDASTGPEGDAAPPDDSPAT